MEKAFEIQKKVRDNAKTFQTYLTDLQNWEIEMKRKEAALNGEFEQDLPPVRSKIKKEKPVVVKKPVEKRIRSFDYQLWDKFDVDKACEEVDMAEVGPVSLDSKKSQQDKEDKFREEAQYEKERGNAFVKQEKWDEAIACYTRAIELVKDDAIYYANRGLCYLKKDSLHQAESDCTEALRLDGSYVKALQRRAAARERLGSLRAASKDLALVLRLEPKNTRAREQLTALTARMGTKGSKSKSSPSPTPTVEQKPITEIKPQPKIVELPDTPVTQSNPVTPSNPVTQSNPVTPSNPVAQSNLVTQSNPVTKWQDSTEGITVIKPVKKPPHLRSKRPLKSIPIHEISLGKTQPDKPPTRLTIVEIEDNLAQGDSNNNDSNKTNTADKPSAREDIMDAKGILDKEIITVKTTDGIKQDAKASPESVKLITDSIASEKYFGARKLVAPVNSVQFMSEWKYLKDNDVARSDYLSLIEPSNIPSIFENALESDVLSELLRMLAEHTVKFKERTVTAYLDGITRVKRFCALAMFLTTSDKLLLTKLLDHCKNVERCSDEDIADLKNKYEL